MTAATAWPFWLTGSIPAESGPEGRAQGQAAGPEWLDTWVPAGAPDAGMEQEPAASAKAGSQDCCVHCAPGKWGRCRGVTWPGLQRGHPDPHLPPGQKSPKAE